MSFTDTSKANYAFKALLGKAHTSSSREIANETLKSGVTAIASRIWADTIPLSGATAVAAGVAVFVPGLLLDVVSGAVISSVQVSYRLKLPGAVPAGLVGKINPATGLVYASGDYVASIIPESYGIVGASDFRPILKENGTEIPPLDSSDWFLDPFAGIVTREADGDSVGRVWTAPLTMDAYIYCGNTVTDYITALISLSGSGSGITEAPINGQIYARQNGAWTAITSGGSSNGSSISVNSISAGSISFIGSGGTSVSTNLLTKIITISSNTTVDTSQFGTILTGQIDIITGQDTFTVSHINISGSSYPLVSMVVPNSAAPLYIQSISNTSTSGFDIIISGIATKSGYKINWQRAVSGYINVGISNVAPHEITHESGGSDAIKLDRLAPPDDNTTLNASISAHGLLKKLSGNANEFLNGLGNWTIITGSIGVSASAIAHDETPVGIINGINQTFTISALPITGSLLLFEDGIRLTEISDYTIVGQTITCISPPSSGSSIRTTYWEYPPGVSSSYPISGMYSSYPALSFDEALSGANDGINSIFYLSNVPISSSLLIFRNGMRLSTLIDYNLSGSRIGFITPPSSGSGLRGTYWSQPIQALADIASHVAQYDPHTQYAFKSRLPINVKDYGATGDGTTDDYASIYSAITSAEAYTEIYFPPGIYRTSSQITVNKPLYFIGDNQNVVTVKGDQGIAFGQGALIRFNAFPCGMSDLTIDGQSPTNGYHLVSLVAGCSGASFDRCHFTNMKTRAALRAGWEATSGSNRGFLKVRNCLFDSGTSAGAIAFYTDSTGKGVYNVEVSDNRMVDVGGPCCAIEDTSTTPDGKYDGFFNTIVKNNYILANNTGPDGPIPAELWGHTNLQVIGNQVEAGTRGIGMAQCKKSIWASNIIKNQTLYASEIAGSIDCAFSNNTIENCRSFVEDTSLAPDSASSGITIIGNTVIGSGLSVLDGSAACIKANALAFGTGWKVLNNSFKNYANATTLIDLAGISGSGKHIVKGNTYEVTLPSSTFSMYSCRGDGCIATNNTITVASDYTSANPQWGGAPTCIGHDPLATNALIADNDVVFTGAMSANGVFAYGASSGTVSSTVNYLRNRASGAFYYIISLNGNSSCNYKGNDWNRATGIISIANSSHKSDTELYNHNDGLAGTIRENVYETDGIRRVSIGAYSDVETAGNGGSRAYCETFDVSGASLGFAWYFTRINAFGVGFLSRPQVWISSVAANQDLDVRLDTPYGNYGELTFYEGGVRRTKFSKLPGGDLALQMFNAGGGYVDSAVTWTNAANGVVAYLRPLTITNSQPCSTPSADSVSIGAGTIRIARTTDALSDEVVRGDDSRLGVKLLSTVTTSGSTTVSSPYNCFVFTGTNPHTLNLRNCITNTQIIIKNRSLGSVTVIPSGSNTIDGLSTYILSGGRNSSITVIGNNIDWVIV